MPDFTAKVRINYKDVDGLVIDCREDDLPFIGGTHTGSNGVAILTDSAKSWTPDSLIGGIVYNLTDGSSGSITDNDATTVTATLAGGAGNVWDTNDSYSIMLPTFEWANNAPPARALYEGSHNGANNAATLFDSGRNWRPDQLVGMTAYNITDGSSGPVTANSANSVTAVLAGGAGNDWDADDVYALTTPRFGNPYQTTVANCPVVTEAGGIRQLNFYRANANFIIVPLDYAFPSGEWSAAFDFTQGVSVANSQSIFNFPGANDLGARRRNAGGNYGYSAGSVDVDSVGDMATGTWLFTYTSAVASSFYRAAVVQLSGGASVTAKIPASQTAGFIGKSDVAAVDYAEMDLKSFQLWDRRMSPLEVDFVYQTLPQTNESVQSRAPVALTEWADDVSAYSRVNPTINAPHRYKLASFSNGQRRRVQIAAQVGGRTLPDAELGGDLFQITPIETPGAAPAVHKDAGWSSVFDLEVYDEGHYTYCLTRLDGGSVILHFDVDLT